ncbi:lytic murein transglycosylase [Saccharopolyspora erythraea]|uniref:Transglycosylase SLT domain-containing protein n=2 Tax=Saccharopolyspora erythraea TaxID=1836 RepID=A4F808_SACEN|nr:lytic murein transglycosylase [Saccharopolyspora erythraea]EQD85785.1 lytic transglycosylase [Saccharopolyspora erythraea D]QRK93300.1 lytic transglycosylase domain-containing protein [Saccharopolyspora erythraea]CAM00182.1 hypothetical protein SACE_0842 [Saccharopolyspora erythraea NRRL 2338]
MAVTALTPVLLVPAALIGASSGFYASAPTAGGALRTDADPRELGAGGRIPQADQLSPDVLDRAGDPDGLATGAGPAVEVPSGPLGIPEPMLSAYVAAAERASESTPSCGVHWSVLASIGRIESGHARGGEIDVVGTTVQAILGPRLSGGPGIAAIPDTDGGQYDGDPTWDRAVGSMQFIPSTWRKYATDGNRDGVSSPHNVHDATVAAADYLCSGGTNLREPANLAAAVFRYNHSDEYVRTVLVWAAAYAKGVTPTPSELAPEVDDVLEGNRLPDGPAVLAMPQTPPPAGAPAPAPAPGPSPTPTAHPPNGTPPPAPSSTPPSSNPPGSTPPGSSPPPGSSQPPPESSKPPESTTPPPGSSQPPPESSTPPESTTPPPDSSTPPPDSTTPPPESSTPPESTTPPPDSSTPPPDSTTPPPDSSTPPPGSSTPPEEPGPPSSCQVPVLHNGEFVTEQDRPTAGNDLPPGRTDPAAATAGATVYVEPGDGGSLVPCVVPDDYAPAQR